MQLWNYKQQYINTDRIIRVEQKDDLFYLFWLDERNAVQTIVLRPDEWKNIRGEIQD